MQKSNLEERIDLLTEVLQSISKILQKQLKLQEAQVDLLRKIAARRNN